MLDLSRTAAVVLDVDGTIAGADHQVTQRTLDAMSTLERSGVPIVLATGRSRRNVLDIALSAGLRTPVVSCNGAVVTDPQSGEDLRCQLMCHDDIESMVTVHERSGQALTWWTRHHIFVTTEHLRQALLELGENSVHVASPQAIVPSSVVKMMIFGDRSELDDITMDVVALAPRATRSMDEFWELTDPDANKWSGVSFILNAIGVDAKRVAGLGDGGNDVVWMGQIGMPVAMGNARGEVVAVARAVAGHHATEGAAVFLEEMARQLRASAPPSPDRIGPLDRTPREHAETGFDR